MANRPSIFTLSKDGALSSLKPGVPESEDYMQSLVAKHPEIIVDDDGDLLLIKREQSIGDGDVAGRWSVDHLFVTRNAVSVLVELKRAVDTRIRREVVGQMLDYAANSTAYWKAGQIAETFAAQAAGNGQVAEDVLSEFLGPAADPSEFWAQVDANFSAGRIKLVFVADTIPRELARIVEFLNEQMRADVRAVELSWFESIDGGKAFTPRVIGATERSVNEKAARAGKPSMTREQWINEFIVPLGVGAVQALANFEASVAATGGTTELTSTQASIIAMYDIGGTKIFPFSFNKYNKFEGGAIQFNTAYLTNKPGFASTETRQSLYDELVGIVGPLSTNSLNGYPSFSATILNDDAVRMQWEHFLNTIRTLADTDAS